MEWCVEEAIDLASFLLSESCLVFFKNSSFGFFVLMIDLVLHELKQSHRLHVEHISLLLCPFRSIIRIEVFITNLAVDKSIFKSYFFLVFVFNVLKKDFLFICLVEKTIFSTQALINQPHLVSLHFIEDCVKNAFWWLHIFVLEWNLDSSIV